MPHKRKTRLNGNQKNSASRRVQLVNQPSAPPHALVESCNGQAADNATPERPKTSKGAVLTSTSRPLTLHKFAVPQYNTSVRKQDEINLLSQIQVDPSLSPGAKAVIAPRVTQKMNFPPSKTVFKDLVPLNVNDSMLIPSNFKGSSSKEKRTKDTDLNKANIEPQLADYADNVDPITIAIPEPQIRMDFVQEPFDFLGAYKRVYY
ncbi:uncharacterized protein LOC108100999 [Drosophila ficusphila]|uniref:uncharacterized protein LOC108100999 n=1 Tax=Drosophila ficusphila TaxID=30025 RepID=UPI0007E81EC5|nr:uncharacterized protein LOC108100999 [Drosophila ficusphila]